jgi:hypothetical protein
MINLCAICSGLYESRSELAPREPCGRCWRLGWRCDAFGNAPYRLEGALEPAAASHDASAKIADLKRQLAAERDHGERLQQQLDAILRTQLHFFDDAAGRLELTAELERDLAR